MEPEDADPEPKLGTLGEAAVGSADEGTEPTLGMLPDFADEPEPKKG